MARRTDRPESIVPEYLYGRQQRTPATWRINVRNVLVWASALALIGLVGWLYLLQASQVSGYAQEIRTLQLAKERIHRINTVLTGQAAELGSLARIREAGARMGYSLPSGEDATRRATLVYEPLPSAAPTGVAEHATVGPQAATDEGAPEGATSLFDRLRRQLDAWLHAAQPAREVE